MNKIYKDDIHRIAIKNGRDGIIEKYTEETQELLDGLLANDIPNVKEEVVDVMIMCEQIIKLYGFSEDSLKEIKEYKIKRTKERLGIKDEKS